MIVVIIAMAFIGILASVLMYMSLLNYQMKVNNLKAKDNFYSAETVLDEIRVGMQSRVSESIGEAYQNILLNYDSASMEEKNVKSALWIFIPNAAILWNKAGIRIYGAGCVQSGGNVRISVR